jgi:uncharacterized SAM-binding protein YcdF (DUF218 family)
MEGQPKLDPFTETALRSLHDIALPPPVSWMPQTWGWLALAILLLAVLLICAFLAYRKWQRNAYRREALRLLAGIEIKLRNPDTREKAIESLGELMKRTALAAWPRQEIAAASGADWVSFLQAHGEAGETLRTILDDLEYQHRTRVTADVAHDLSTNARRWIEGHHVSA